MRKFLLAKLSLVILLSTSFVSAEVSVLVGPTPIPRGDAVGARDITVTNGDLFAIAFAVDTAPPWGVARGGIVDIALLRDGELDYDIASLADFMPNNWSSWPTTYQQVTIEKQSGAEAIVKTLRDWGEVELETTFHIRDGDHKIHIKTKMTNNGEAALTDLHSGYVAWPDGGSLFGMPGLPTVPVSPEDTATGDWSAAYGERWLLGLHAPFSKIMAYGGRDRYLPHSLEPGESRTLEAWLQIESEGTLAPLVAAEIEFQHLPSGRISGTVVTDNGDLVAKPAVVVLQDGVPYSWTIGSNGKYEIELPVDNYEVYATARGHSQGATEHVTVTKDCETQLDFSDVRPPGALQMQVTDKESGAALDARISIQEGNKSLIGYFGKNTFFTELDPIGEITESIAPGHYVLAVSAGAGFTATPQLIEMDIEPGETLSLDVEIPRIAAPNAHGWYSADLHHHSDVLDGFTEAEFVMRSELASGVDITFLSDHDSVINNAEMERLSVRRGIPFIPATELSPSWAHFNAYPIDEGKTVDIDTGQATVQEIFRAARGMGADIVEVNHPYSQYGYFESDENGAVPGDYNSEFDLIEIEPNDQVRNNKTLRRVWRMWNDGQRAYLAAGSDVHDVWLTESGGARTYAHVHGDLNVDKFIAALKGGRSFASQGPLVFPAIMFGSEIQHAVGNQLVLAYSVVAVNGLKSVQLIEQGRENDLLSFVGTDKRVPVEFSVSPDTDTWYSLVIEDQSGKFAYTNPVWVTVTK